MLAHRYAYELLVGPISEALTIDHTCHNGSGCEGGRLCIHRRCVNPADFEVVTLAVNVLRGESPPARNKRKTTCPRGHPYDAVNTYVNPGSGWRLCRTCQRDRSAVRRGGDAQ